MNKNKYVFASFSKFESIGVRVGGPGLGNLLFPWARAVVLSKKYNIERICSTWKTIKIGTYVRKERDKRVYADLFNESGVCRIKKWFILNTFPKVKEKDALDFIKSKKRGLVICKGMDDLFNPILQNNKLIKQEIYNMLTSKSMNIVDNYKGADIAVHIRMGDFQEAPSEELLRNGSWNYRLPLKWYVSIINKLREETGKNLEVHIFSDGADDELLPILKLGNTKRVFLNSAINDMLALGKSKVLIASGSTFSMWGSFLGENSTVWYPGQMRQKLHDGNIAFEGELDYKDKIPSNLISVLKSD